MDREKLIEKVMSRAYKKCPEKYSLDYYQAMRDFTIRAIKITIKILEKESLK